MPDPKKADVLLPPCKLKFGRLCSPFCKARSNFTENILVMPWCLTMLGVHVSRPLFADYHFLQWCLQTLQCYLLKVAWQLTVLCFDFLPVSHHADFTVPYR